MRMSTARVVLFLFVINLGIAFGAGLYESVIVLPGWLRADTNGTVHWNSAAAVEDNPGLRFWIFASTIPLTLLAGTNLWIALRRCEGSLRNWWMTGAVLALLDRMMTILYFIPVMIGLMGSADTPDAAASAQRWISLNSIRHLLVFGAWMAAFRTWTLAQGAKRRPVAYYEDAGLRDTVEGIRQTASANRKVATGDS
jgi:hypothetical protein